VRWQASLPAAAQRRTVLALTPSNSAACCTRNHLDSLGPALIAEVIGLRGPILEQLCQPLPAGRLSATTAKRC
jgi:hypothetical protein